MVALEVLYNGESLNGSVHKIAEWPSVSEEVITGRRNRDRANPRGRSNGNQRGNTTLRRRRREYLVDKYRADVDVIALTKPHPLVDGWVEVHIVREVPRGEGQPACRCYRCPQMLTVDSVSADKIVPNWQGGTYAFANLRPACIKCQSITGNEEKVKKAAHEAKVRRRG